MNSKIDVSRCSPYSQLYDGKKYGCIRSDDKEKIDAFLSENGSRKNTFDKLYDEYIECRDEMCLLDKLIENTNDKKKEIIKEIKKKSYKPLIPEDWLVCERKKCHTKWLTNKNIYQIIENYEDAYSNFMYLGTFMINFQKYDCKSIEKWTFEPDNVPFSKYEKMGVNCLGMVLNTAKKGHKGEHWIALFIFWRNGKGEINFFDSYGMNAKIPDEVLDVMKKIQDCGHKYGIRFTCQSSKKRHQKKNSECGVYCLYFIIHSLNHSLKSIDSMHHLTDDKINKYRFEFWRTS